MRFWVGITDRAWYEQLRLGPHREVNFWQPSARPLANFIDTGVPFLFKLHAPENFIAGAAVVSAFRVLPARLAWDAFDRRNGTSSYAELLQRVEKYRKERLNGDPEIGCHLLADPVFFDRADWIPVPATMHRNVQRGMTFDTSTAEGAALWSEVQQRISGHWLETAEAPSSHPRYGPARLYRPRWGQGTFRVMVTDAYERRCAISGEKTLPVLEAAHIKGYKDEGEHMVQNGLLLRADLHKLFDDRLLTVTPDLRVQISRRIREEYQNGREYYRFDGQALRRPPNPLDGPDAGFLRWHNEQFVA